MADNETKAPGATPPGDGPAPGVTPTPDGQAPNGSQQSPDQSKWTLEDWKRFALDRDGAAKTANADAVEKRKRLKAFEDAKAKTDAETEAAETERLRLAGEHQKLAEQYKGELDQVKPQFTGLQGKYDELSKLAKTRLEAEVKDWPDKLKAKLPQGETVDVLDYARAIDNFRDLAEDYGKQQAGSGYGRNGAGPNPAGAAQPDLDKAAKEHGRIYATNY